MSDIRKMDGGIPQRILGEQSRRQNDRFNLTKEEYAKLHPEYALLFGKTFMKSIGMDLPEVQETEVVQENNE